MACICYTIFRRDMRGVLGDGYKQRPITIVHKLLMNTYRESPICQMKNSIDYIGILPEISKVQYNISKEIAVSGAGNGCHMKILKCDEGVTQHPLPDHHCPPGYT